MFLVVRVFLQCPSVSSLLHISMCIKLKLSLPRQQIQRRHLLFASQIRRRTRYTRLACCFDYVCLFVLICLILKLLFDFKLCSFAFPIFLVSSYLLFIISYLFLIYLFVFVLFYFVLQVVWLRKRKFSGTQCQEDAVEEQLFS